MKIEEIIMSLDKRLIRIESIVWVVFGLTGLKAIGDAIPLIAAYLK